MDLRLETTKFTQENFITLLELNAKLSEENEQLQRNQQALENQIACYVEQIRLSKVRQFSGKSETSNQLELTLSFAFDETDESDNLEEVRAGSNQVETETISYVRKKKTVGRRIDTSKLPREVIIHDLSEAEKCCDKCGNQLEKFGEDKSEQLEYIPAQVKVIPKSMAAPSLIAPKP